MTIVLSPAKKLASLADCLPEGWVRVRISDIYDSWGGATPSRSRADYWGPGVPWITSKELKDGWITEGTQSVSDLALADTRLRKCPPGTVLLVVRSGVLANRLPIAVTRRSVVINQDLKAFTACDPRLNPWLALALRASSSSILEENRREGTTVQSVNFGQLIRREIPLPPLAEQERVVPAVARLTARVDAARERLAKVPTILKRFRQAVLAAACSGRLTSDWREQHPGEVSGTELLSCLAAEREALWLERNRNRKYRPAEAVAEEELPEIPSKWIWTNFDHCAWEITVGHVGPMKARYVEEGIPFLRSQNIRPLRFDPNGLVFVNSDFHALLRKSVLTGGEILVTRSGANTGDCCVYPEEAGVANCADLVVTRPLSGLVAAYGAIYISSPEGQARIGLRETGMAQPHFNIGAMKVKPFPLPPTAEQVEIVRRVEALMKLTDAIEQRVELASARADKTTQAILAKAFRGELVPTEADLARAEGRTYESAVELIARIADTNNGNSNSRRQPRATR